VTQTWPTTSTQSTTGVLFFLGLNPVTWQSQKQKVVALSSCEAEYIVGMTTACQGCRSLLLRSFTMKMDNESTIALCKNPVHHDRSKHIDTRYHFIKQCITKGRIDVMFVGTETQLTDILTKPLGHTRFRELRGPIVSTRSEVKARFRG
jgi:hypothetical protein